MFTIHTQTNLQNKLLTANLRFLLLEIVAIAGLSIAVFYWVLPTTVEAVFHGPDQNNPQQPQGNNSYSANNYSQNNGNSVSQPGDPYSNVSYTTHYQNGATTVTTYDRNTGAYRDIELSGGDDDGGFGPGGTVTTGSGCTLAAIPNPVPSGNAVKLEWLGLSPIVTDFFTANPGYLKLYSNIDPSARSDFDIFIANIGDETEYTVNPTVDTTYKVLGPLGLSCISKVEITKPTDLAARLTKVSDQLATVPYSFTFSSARNIGTLPVTGDVRVALQFDYKRDGWDGDGVDGDFQVSQIITAPENFGDSVTATFPNIVHSQAGNWAVQFLVDTDNAIEADGLPSRVNNTSQWENFKVDPAPPGPWCHRVEAQHGTVGFGSNFVKYYDVAQNVTHLTMLSSFDNPTGSAPRNFADDRVMHSTAGDDYHNWSVYINRDDAYVEANRPGWQWVAVNDKNTHNFASTDVNGGSMTMSYRRNISRPECAIPVTPDTSSISSTGCEIALNGSTCQGALTWDATDSSIVSPRVFNRNVNTIFSTAVTGNNQPVTLNYGLTEFILRDGTTDLDTTSPQASCVAGSSWNIVANRCEDTDGGNPECSDNVDNDGDTMIDEDDPGCWTNPLDPTTYDPTDNSEFYVFPQCFDGIDNADPEDTLVDHEDPGCHTDGDATNPASYNPNDNDERDVYSCVPYISSSLPLVRTGDTVIITWDNCGNNACALSDNLIGYTSGDPFVIEGTTNFSIDCPGGPDPDDEVTVIVLPRVEEN